MFSKAPGLMTLPGQCAELLAPGWGVQGRPHLPEAWPSGRTGSDISLRLTRHLPATPHHGNMELQDLCRSPTWEAGLPNPSCAFVRKGLVSGLGEGVCWGR